MDYADYGAYVTYSLVTVDYRERIKYQKKFCHARTHARTHTVTPTYTHELRNIIRKMNYTNALQAYESHRVNARV